uniref:Calcineurin-like phosphoesterase domain-containing protein n=1 Tax=Plectus sambesii TaxID=2011161 RepID=A0A914W6U2_9BILA
MTTTAAVIVCCSAALLVLPTAAQTHTFKYKETNKAYIYEAKPGDFFQFFLGDPQFHFPCVPENTDCKKQCTNSGTVCESRYANKVQVQSIGALTQQLTARGFRPRSIIMNGDLTDFGQDFELSEFKSQWFMDPQLGGMKIYPGLGNHDIQNTVDHKNCKQNECADRMLSFFIDNLERHLKIRPDYQVYQDAAGKWYYGSFAYSWNECSPTNPSQCVHFVQLNNYPSYSRTIEAYPKGRWTVMSALNWLQRDLAQNQQYPVVVNFHRFDTEFSDADRASFRSIISNKSNRVLGVFFAHNHSGYGVRHEEYWCINGRYVPLLYSGSVPGNNYLLVRFTGDYRTISMVESHHVTGSGYTNVYPLQMKTGSC